MQQKVVPHDVMILIHILIVPIRTPGLVDNNVVVHILIITSGKPEVVHPPCCDTHYKNKTENGSASAAMLSNATSKLTCISSFEDEDDDESSDDDELRACSSDTVSCTSG